MTVFRIRGELGVSSHPKRDCRRGPARLQHLSTVDIDPADPYGLPRSTRHSLSLLVGPQSNLLADRPAR